ncbi:MAG: ABC transporter permease [Clostridiales bacterium]|nr:ABC transporter permease [Clostridiales bacterium]
MVLLLIAVSILSFVLVSISPIDPLQANVGEAALAGMSEAQIEKLREYWGVDTPPFERYMNWAGDVLRGDMGTSLLYRRPVMEVVFEKFSNSVIVLLFAWVFSGVLGFALGVLAGVNRGRFIDKAINTVTLVIASTPSFWLALVFLMFFSVYLGILPVGLSVPIGQLASEVTFGDKLLHAILPALTLSVTGIANITLHTREKMIDVMESDYVLFAKARGESTLSIVKNHGIRNIILPAMTLQFASVSEIFGGSVLVEEVFSYPGLGQAAVNAGLGADVPLLLGITLIMAGIVFTGNLIANVLYGVVDPRIRRGGER